MTSETAPRTVAIVGGGITGLATAFALTNQADSLEISLFESGPRLGGKIRTLEFAGGRIEAGPDSFVARAPWLEDLCRQLGLQEQLMEPAVFGAAVWAGGRLRRFPSPSLWGLPTSPAVALRTDALSLRGRLRALGDMFLPGPLRGPDVSVSDLVERRFGREVLERLVDPLLAGTKAGSIDEMSLAAALPQVDSLARASRSVMSAARATGGSAPRFLSLTGGMEQLVEALEGALEGRVNLRADAPITGLHPVDDGYALTVREGESMHVDAVVLCVPAPTAARLLTNISPDAANLLHAVEEAPVASIALRYPTGAFRIPEGTSGVLVPRGENMTISACTWWSEKWPDAAQAGQVVRCFAGRTLTDRFPASDEELIEACAADIAKITDADTRPQEAIVTRWQEGLPQYRVGHLERLDAVERALVAHPRLTLAGASYRGSGLTDCVGQAIEVARRLADSSEPH